MRRQLIYVPCSLDLRSGGKAAWISYVSRTADVLPGQVTIRILQELLPVRPHGSLRSKRFHRPNARPEGPLFIRHTEAEEHNIDLVPADSKLKRPLGYDEPMFADAATRWDELDQIFKCRRCGWVGHATKIRRKSIVSTRTPFPCP